MLYILDMIDTVNPTCGDKYLVGWYTVDIALLDYTYNMLLKWIGMILVGTC